jgi:hypothetical protein
LHKLLLLPLPAEMQEKVKQLSSKLFLDKAKDYRMIQALGPQLLKASTKEVQVKLRDPNAAVRWMSIAVIAQRRLPLEQDLISILDDPDIGIHEAAHQALVRLARGTDFGPGPTARGGTYPRSIAKWRQWLALQEKARAEMAVRTPPPLEPIPIAIAANREHERSAVRLRMDLVKSRGQEQESALRQLTEGEGVAYTSALAEAIPDLTGSLADKAREALVERLAKLSKEKCRQALGDNRAEMRRAAVRACLLKKDRDAIPGLIALLRDKDDGVARAAHVALKGLSGRDFGPALDATNEQRRRAEAEWLAWWKTQAASK